ncbi:unnamed protein product [Adineta steineri]|uniref:G-protein coupled receptors family 1 profile domain-containing protein n=1 Tax=Adineta steineri TaxID=433720 RepID=A0A813MFZ0_9BILA|nr:unnamed protein product [Adineta steineri]CAF4232806.1 unnamed protein product [Adineta steineri]
MSSTNTVASAILQLQVISQDISIALGFILLISGTIGNWKHNASSLYIFVKSLFDLFVLIIGVTNQITRLGFNIDLTAQSRVWCKLAISLINITFLNSLTFSVFSFLTYRNLQTLTTQDRHSLSTLTRQVISLALLQVITLLVFQVPYAIVQIYTLVTINLAKSTYRQAQEQVVIYFFHGYVYGTFTCSFYCYCIVSKRFRKEVFGVLTRFLSPPRTTQVQPRHQRTTQL